MKTLLTILALVLVAGGAVAQEWVWYGGAMGIYFSDTEFSNETTNLVPVPAPFDFYVVLTDAQVSSVAGYECGFEFSAPDVFLLTAYGCCGWLNFGDISNQLVGFQTPVPVDGNGAAVLCTVTALYMGTDTVTITMGPSEPSTGDPGSNPWGYSWDGPIIADGDDYNTLLCCHLSSGVADAPGVVASLNGYSVATENQSWTQVRNLFE